MSDDWRLTISLRDEGAGGGPPGGPGRVGRRGREGGKGGERRVRRARETEESLASGYAEWEVRVELESHHDTIALARRLESDGLPVVRRHTFLLVGAGNEDEARGPAGRRGG